MNPTAEPNDQAIGKNPYLSLILLPKFPKEYCNILRQIGDYCAHKIQLALKQYLRMNIEVFWNGLELMLFMDFIKQLHTTLPCCIHILHSSKLQHYSLLVQNLKTVSALMERVLGSRSTKNTVLVEFTSMDVAVIGKLTMLISAEIEKSLHAIVPVFWKIERQETNPMLASVIPDKENVVVLNFTVKGDLPPGNIQLCLVTADLMAHLEVYKKSQGSANTQTQNNSIARQLAQVPLSVSLRLGEVQLQYGNLNELAPGDIIRSDRKLSDACEVYVENDGKYTGKLGKIGNVWACTVEKTLGGAKHERQRPAAGKAGDGITH